MLIGYFALYFVLAGFVIFFSVKLADYVDLIDKKSNISGAFIGGVILAAVTSLPELFTSISATVLIKKPEMVIGNILGSNIFNMTVLGVLVIFGAKGFARSVVGNSHLKTIAFTAGMFALMYLPTNLGFDFEVFGISIYSVIIIVAYIFSVRFMAGDSAESDNAECNSNLTMKQIVLRFVIMAVLLVVASIFITKVTDLLAVELNLGATIAGAIFLGVATSLPELTSCIALARKGNYNACVGNVLGSGMFNFCILAISDLLYRKGSAYIGSSETATLTNFCVLGSAVVILLLAVKKTSKQKDSTALKLFYRVCGLAITACYVLFIVLS